MFEKEEERNMEMMERCIVCRWMEEWMRDGIGEEYDENEIVVRRGRWIEGAIQRFEDGYGNECFWYWLFERNWDS